VERIADTDTKVRALRLPSAYAEGAKQITAVETHFAWVFLTDSYAYKLKKPIRADRLDQTTLALRRTACSEELRLNRRLAPTVYLGSVPLTCDSDNTIRVNGNGRIIDWLLKMRRLPQDLMLDRAMTAATVDASALTALGTLLSTFHRAQSPIDLTEEDYALSVRNRIDELVRELRAPDLRLDAYVVEQWHAAQLRSLHDLNAELRARPAMRGIIDAHGDLRPEHVYLGSPPCVIDSLEFSAELRTLDPIEDLAYLYIECAHAGHAEIGDAILRSYRNSAADEFSSGLFNLYCGLRAANRAKIVSWHLRDPQVRERCDWRSIAEAYVVDATHYVQHH
jgi:aminoglycoside phosphotransferase family enzyme